MRQLTLATGRSTWLPYGWAGIALSLECRVIYPDVICLSQSGLALMRFLLELLTAQVMSGVLGSIAWVCCDTQRSF